MPQHMFYRPVARQSCRCGGKLGKVPPPWLASGRIEVARERSKEPDQIGGIISFYLFLLSVHLQLFFDPGAHAM